MKSIARRRSLLSVVATGALVAAATTMPGAADAAGTPSKFIYAGSAGGTSVQAVGLAVESDPTASSRLVGSNNVSTHNSIAKVQVSQLLSAGAITTDATGARFGDGSSIKTHAKTAGVSLLGGLIKVDAVDTTATASGNTTSAPTGSASSTLVGLTIAGKKYPVNVAPNTGITIPGVATVQINFSATGSTSTASTTLGAGLLVTLLKQRGRAAAGAIIEVNPVYAAVEQADAPGSGARVGGMAYGSYVHANVGSSVTVESGRTAGINMPALGTHDNTLTNSTARVRLPGVLNLGAVDSSAKGINSAARSEVTDTSEITGVNLFNGLIRAQAIGSVSHAVYDGASRTGSEDGNLQFIDLKIAGKDIPINPKPNTVIHVANLGTVTLNQQTVADIPGTYNAISVVGLDVVLDTKRAGLPVGAEVQLAVSSAIVYG